MLFDKNKEHSNITENYLIIINDQKMNIKTTEDKIKKMNSDFYNLKLEYKDKENAYTLEIISKKSLIEKNLFEINDKDN